MAERPFEPVPNTPLVDDPTSDAIWKRWLQGLQRFMGAAVRGPGSSTDNAVARWDGTDGQFLNNSGVIIDDSNNVTGVASLTATSITDSGLTSGRVVLASTAGLLADDADLTFNAGTNTLSTINLNVTGNTTLGDAAGDTVTVNGTAVTIPNGLNFDSNTLVIDATNNRVGINVASPTAPLDVLQGTLGNAVQVLSSTASNDDANEITYQNKVTTTDATTTTIATVAIPASTTVFIEVKVVARRTGGSAGTAEDGAAYMVDAAYKNVAGTATEIGESSIFSAEDQAGWGVSVTPSSGNALIQVTGAVNNNISWIATYRTYSVSS